MVKPVTCELCGLETKHPIVKEIDGQDLDFCCIGCWQVYEFAWEEGTLEQVKAEEVAKRSKENKR
jgi:hypothetical protein